MDEVDGLKNWDIWNFLPEIRYWQKPAETGRELTI